MLFIPVVSSLNCVLGSWFPFKALFLSLLMVSRRQAMYSVSRPSTLGRRRSIKWRPIPPVHYVDKTGCSPNDRYSGIYRYSACSCATVPAAPDVMTCLRCDGSLYRESESGVTGRARRTFPTWGLGRDANAESGEADPPDLGSWSGR